MKPSPEIKLLMARGFLVPSASLLIWPYLWLQKTPQSSGCKKHRSQVKTGRIIWEQAKLVGTYETPRMRSSALDGCKKPTAGLRNRWQQN
jgi:hypothetical protein